MEPKKVPVPNVQPTHIPLPEVPQPMEPVQPEAELADAPVIEPIPPEAMIREVADRANQRVAEIRVQYMMEKHGIKPEQIDAWKEHFGLIETVHILGQLYVYRGISRHEASMIGEDLTKRGMNTPEKREEEAVTRALLYPALHPGELRQLPAGVASTLAEGITLLSGYTTDDAPIRL